MFRIHVAGPVDHLLQVTARARGQFGNAPGHRLGLVEKLSFGHHFPGQTHLQRLVRVEAFAEENQLFRLLQSDEFGQQCGEGPGYENAERNFGEKAARARGHERQIAIDHPLQAAAGRPAVDRADDHLLAHHHLAGDVLDGFDVGPGDCLGSDLAIEFLQIVSGTECATGSPQDDCAHRRIGVAVRKDRLQGGQQGWVYRIESLRAIQGDGTDAVIDMAEDGGIHFFSLRMPRRVLPAVRGRLFGGIRAICAVTCSALLIATESACSSAVSPCRLGSSSTSSGSRS